MMKTIKTVTILALLLAASIPAQQRESSFYVRGSMGLQFTNAPELRDYINANFAPSSDQVASFFSAVSFGAESGYEFSFGTVALEYTYSLSSFEYPYPAGRYDLSYSSISLTPIYSKTYWGQGYNFKIGGGIGFQLASVDEILPSLTEATEYSTIGWGAVLKAEGNTALAQSTYAYIALDLRASFPGTPESGGKTIKTNFGKEDLILSFYSAGIALGVTHYF